MNNIGYILSKRMMACNNCIPEHMLTRKVTSASLRFLASGLLIGSLGSLGAFSGQTLVFFSTICISILITLIAYAFWSSSLFDNGVHNVDPTINLLRSRMLTRPADKSRRQPISFEQALFYSEHKKLYTIMKELDDKISSSEKNLSQEYMLNLHHELSFIYRLFKSYAQNLKEDETLKIAHNLLCANGRLQRLLESSLLYWDEGLHDHLKKYFISWISPDMMHLFLKSRGIQHVESDSNSKLFDQCLKYFPHRYKKSFFISYK